MNRLLVRHAKDDMHAVGSAPDFHVVSLRYVLRLNNRVTYVSPPLVEFETEEARFRLADGNLTCEIKTHFKTAEAARAVVEPVLRAWEVDADLRWNQGELRFKFDGVEIIDRSLAPPGVSRGHAHMTGVAAVSFVGTVSVHVSRGHYPEPPGTFRLNPDAESISHRYRGYLDGREPLLSMAYFCLTVLEANCRGRAPAAAAYRINEAVLGKMGELATRRGDRSNARKATAGPVQPLTGAESAWLESAVKTLIWRLGDTREATTLPLITMSDLPAL